MESMLLLSLVAALIVAPATAIQPATFEEASNSSDPVPIIRFNIKSIFPFFGPVDFDEGKDREPLDDTISPMEPSTNESDASGGVVSIHIMEVFSIQDPSQQDVLGEPMAEFGNSKGGLLQKLFDNILADMGLLDLSGKTMTGPEVYAALRARREAGRPVTTLILRNSRIHPMDSGTFAIAEGTISTLDLSNSSVNVDALRGLTNLKVLNLSNNALTSIPWYGLMANSLEVLDLSHNQLGEVRPELSMLKNLRELYMSHNQIMFVEESPLNLLFNLETLDLSMNVLLRANFADLTSLKRLDVSWNYLRLMGTDCLLPPQPLSLKLSSNPWRCDCDLLAARDNCEILDLDWLQCANHQSYRYCDDCPREFLPPQDSPDIQNVFEMNKESIHHLGCYDLPELYLAIDRLRRDEPEKFVQDVCLFTGLVMILIGSIIFVVVKCCRKKNIKKKFWMRVQQIPHLEKLAKPQEVPYIKIDEPGVKA